LNGKERGSEKETDRGSFYEKQAKANALLNTRNPAKLPAGKRRIKLSRAAS